MADSYEDIVSLAAQKLGLLNQAGDIVELDSLAMIDLAMEIEESAGIRIPTVSLIAETFTSKASIVELLRGVSEGERS